MMEVNMALFNNFKKKNYLKRTDLINSVDSNKYGPNQ
jgi:hypothetical protein